MYIQKSRQKFSCLLTSLPCLSPDSTGFTCGYSGMMDDEVKVKASHATGENMSSSLNKNSVLHEKAGVNACECVHINKITKIDQAGKETIITFTLTVWCRQMLRHSTLSFRREKEREYRDEWKWIMSISHRFLHSREVAIIHTIMSM